jgi:tetratricopeptide (TPR) repeat protein
VQARITALLDLGQRQRASIKLNPEEQRRALSDEARAFFDRGTRLYSAGHYKAAAAAFTAALQLSDAPELHYNLAVAAERLGDVADALDHYRAYLEALPEAPDRVEVLARLDALRNELR